MKRLLIASAVIVLMSGCNKAVPKVDKNGEIISKSVVVEHLVTQDGLECVYYERNYRKSGMSCNWPAYNWKKNNGKL